VAGVAFPLSVTSAQATRIRIDSSRGAPNYANAGVGLYASDVQKWSFAHYSTDSGVNYDFTIYNDALTSSALLVKGSNSNVLIGTTTDGGQKLQVTGTLALRSSASGSVATQIPVFIADPSSTTRELVTRTPAQLLSDIGGQAVLTNPVTGTASAGQVAYWSSSSAITGESNLFWDSTNDRLGIGSTPTFRFDVETSNLTVGRFYSNATGKRNNILLQNSQNFNYGVLGVVSGTGVSTGDVYGLGYSASGSTAFTEVLNWTSTGNVGIGTASPTAKLQITSTSAGAATVAAFLLNESVTTSTEVRLAFAANTNNDIATNRYSYISALNTSGSNGQALLFATNETGNSAVERMRITSGGDVLIGTTTNYSSKLVVIPSSNPTSSTGANNQISIGETSQNINYSLKIGYIFTGGGYQGSIQSIAGGSGSTLFLNASGGNVIIGTTTDAGFKLDVNGTGRFSGLITGQTTSAATITQNFLAYNSGSSISGASYDFQSGGTSQTARISANYEASGPDRMAMRFLVGQGSGLVEILKLFNSTMTVTGAATFSSSVTLTSGYLSVDGFGNASTNYITMRSGFVPNTSGGIGLMAIDHSGSSTDGLACYGHDGISFYTAQTERMRITSGGNVLIGTTTDAGYKLDVNGNERVSGDVTLSGNRSLIFSNPGIAAGAIRFFNSTTSSTRSGIGSYYNIADEGNLEFLTGGTSTKMVITSGGNVGIGTTSPSRLLTVSKPSDGDIALFTNTVNADLNLNLSSGVTLLSPSTGIFAFGTSLTERMRITSGGNVLIGTTSDVGVRLYVKGSTATNLYLESTGASVYQQFVNSGGSAFIGTTSNDLLFLTTGSGTERMRITSGGNVLIGTTTTIGPVQGKLDVLYDGILSYGMNLKTTYSSGGLAISFNNSSGSQVGNINTTFSATSYNTSSDYRLKTDLKDYNGMDIINKIKTYDFKWKSENSRSYGVIAHELKEVIDYVVHGQKDSVTMQGVDYSKLVPIMVKAIQEQQAQIQELKNKLS